MIKSVCVSITMTAFLVEFSMSKGKTLNQLWCRAGLYGQNVITNQNEVAVNIDNYHNKCQIIIYFCSEWKFQKPDG